LLYSLSKFTSPYGVVPGYITPVIVSHYRCWIVDHLPTEESIVITEMHSHQLPGVTQAPADQSPPNPAQYRSSGQCDPSRTATANHPPQN
jgi:hypothetical protein